MTTSNPNKQQVIELLRGVALGRTLHDLEKQAGVSIESFIYLIQTDQDIATAFKSARELSAYVLEDEITTKLRDNAEKPETAKTNALKAWADHLNNAIKARNPQVYSGKADVGAVVNVRFVTTLDLNAPKTIENVYDLTGTVVEESDIKDVTETEYKRLVDELRNEASVGPFEAALDIASEESRVEEAAVLLEQALAGPEPADGHPSVGEGESKQAAREQQASSSPVSPKKRRAPRPRTRKKPAEAEKV